MAPAELVPKKRDLLDLLTRDELLDLADRFGVEVPDRRVKSDLVDALAASHRATLTEMLPTLSRDRLKDLCEAMGLDAGGREKALLVERLLSGGSGKAAAEALPAEPPKRGKDKAAKKNGGDLGFEDKLWRAADELRGNMDAAE